MKRTVKLKEALGKQRLTGLSDASNEAMCAVAYNIWDTPEGPVPQLLLAKVRVTPVNGTTVPRAELQDMVMLTRILITAANASAAKLSKVTLTTDSFSCQAALKGLGTELNPYFANRVAEIKHTIAEVKKEAGQVENFTPVDGSKAGRAGALQHVEEGTRLPTAA